MYSFKCEQCGRQISDVAQVPEPCVFNNPPYRYSYVCPYCGGDISRLIACCDYCGTEIYEDEKYYEREDGEKYCENCVRERRYK